MLTVICPSVELRGIISRVTQQKKPYYLLNVEDKEGNPYQLYCPSDSFIEAGLLKGDIVSIAFEVKYYQGNEKLIVSKVERVL